MPSLHDKHTAQAKDEADAKTKSEAEAVDTALDEEEAAGKKKRRTPKVERKLGKQRKKK